MKTVITANSCLWTKRIRFMASNRSTAWHQNRGAVNLLHNSMKHVKADCIEVIAFEPKFLASDFIWSKVINEPLEFKLMADVIVLSRITVDIKDVAEKCIAAN